MQRGGEAEEGEEEGLGAVIVGFDTCDWRALPPPPHLASRVGVDECGFQATAYVPPPSPHHTPCSHLASGVGVDEGGLQLSIALLGLDEGCQHTVDPLPLVDAEGEVGALKRRHPAA